MSNPIKIMLAVLALFMGSATMAFADQAHDMATGSTALSNRDYVTALRLLRPIAEQGNAEAQWMVGSIYEKGCVTSQAEATLDAMSKSNGYDAPIPKMSSCVPQSYAEAVNWYSKSAEQGNSTGQRELGSAYYFGNGVKKDFAEAAKWYRVSAEQGNQGAQDSLGEMYMEGKGVPLDAAEAEKWINKSHNQIEANAEFARGKGDYNGGNFNAGAPHDYAGAMKHFRKAVEEGNVEALSMIGLMYENGEGVQQDYTEAVTWYRKSADQGDCGGQQTLGRMYEDGNGIPQDYVQAYKWFLLAAASHDSDSIFARHYRDILAKKMTPEQIAEAQKLAREWKPK